MHGALGVAADGGEPWSEDHSSLNSFGSTAKPATRTEVAKDIHGDPEDSIAVVAFTAAIIFAVGMVTHWIPINQLTVGIAACTGAGGVIAKIVGARGGKAHRGLIGLGARA